MNLVIKSLLINKAYIILSTITKKVYVDENRRAYIFYKYIDAIDFVDTHENVDISRAEFFIPDELMTYCYALGVTALVIKENAEEIVELNKDCVKRKFYNSDLNAIINIFRETKSPELLEYLSSCRFIVPVRMKFEMDAQIIYGTVHMNKSYFYLAFSDMDEYKKWEERASGWNPLMIEFDAMWQIAKYHGYVLNPMGNRIMIPGKVMERIKKKAELLENA